MYQFLVAQVLAMIAALKEEHWDANTLGWKDVLIPMVQVLAMIAAISNIHKQKITYQHEN